jgi:hypothetical protein
MNGGEGKRKREREKERERERERERECIIYLNFLIVALCCRNWSSSAWKSGRKIGM